MTAKLTRDAYERLVEEDLTALELLRPEARRLNRQLELNHVIAIVKASPGHEYRPAGSTGHEHKTHEELIAELERVLRHPKASHADRADREGTFIRRYMADVSELIDRLEAATGIHPRPPET